MIAIGNDIIDLADDDCQGIEGNLAFQKRVFTAKELAQFDASTFNQNTYLWLLWSAKEAAYKAAKQLQPNIYFSPIQFEVDPHLQTVNYQGLTLHFTSTIGTSSIHTVAMLNQTDYLIRINQVNKDHSKWVRRQCREMYSQEFNIHPSEISLKSDSYRIPKLYIRSQTLPHPISLSHQGRYVASVIGLAK